MSEPVTPTTETPPAPAPPAPAAPAEPPKVHDFTKHFVESLNVGLDDNLGLKPLEPEAPDPNATPVPLNRPLMTLGEIALEASQKAEAAKKAAEAGTPAAPVTPAATPATPAATPAAPVATPEPVKPIEVRKPSVDTLASKVIDQIRNMPAATPPAAPAPAAPTKTPMEVAQEQWEAGLPEQNRDLLELLRWAESDKTIGADFKGKAAEQAAYFKKLEEFSRANPNADDDAVNEFIAKNKPALSERALRRASHEKILVEAEERAADRIRKENADRLEAIETRQRQIEIRPHVERNEQAFVDWFVAEVPEGKTRAGTPRVAKEVTQMLRADPKKAVETYPVEAPIVQKFQNAASDFMRIYAGLIPQDMNNEDHVFVSSFILRQEQAIMNQPEDKRAIHGKPFLPSAVYARELAKDPTVAQRYATFSYEDILEMMEESAHRAVNAKLDELKKAGFVRQTAAPAPAAPAVPQTPANPAVPTPTPAVTATPAPAEVPRGGGSIAPGAAQPAAPVKNPHMDFMTKIHPEAARMIGP